MLYIWIFVASYSQLIFFSHIVNQAFLKRNISIIPMTKKLLDKCILSWKVRDSSQTLLGGVQGWLPEHRGGVGILSQGALKPLKWLRRRNPQNHSKTFKSIPSSQIDIMYPCMYLNRYQVSAKWIPSS